MYKHGTPFLVGAVLVAGIYVFFLGFGLVQEKIYQLGDAQNGDKFVYSIFLVFCMCVGNMVLSFSLLVVRSGFQRTVDNLRILDREAVWQVLLSSLTYVLSMLCTNYALTHVNYPTQVLVKSAKMVPVVIGGFLLFGKKYPWYDYVSVSIVTFSLIMFNLAKKSKSGAHQTLLGLLLLCVSLFCDGMTGPRQDKLLAKYSFNPVDLMFLTNIFAVAWTATASVALERFEPIAFCVRFPETVTYIAAFCVCAALGQVFIFSSLTAFGSLYLTLITTTRKFFTVLCSVLWFGHSLRRVQWLCVTAIFSSLMLQSYFSKKDKISKKAEEKAT